MHRRTLDDILGGMSRGGFANPPHKDGLPGVGYISNFDPSQLGRSGNEVRNCVYHGGTNPHYDVIERNAVGEHLHHRIYKPY